MSGKQGQEPASLRFIGLCPTDCVPFHEVFPQFSRHFTTVGPGKIYRPAAMDLLELLRWPSHWDAVPDLVMQQCEMAALIARFLIICGIQCAGGRRRQWCISTAHTQLFATAGSADGSRQIALYCVSLEFTEEVGHHGLCSRCLCAGKVLKQWATVLCSSWLLMKRLACMDL